MVPRATEALAEAMVASNRIHAFLNLAEQSREAGHRAEQQQKVASPAKTEDGSVDGSEQGEAEDDVVAVALRNASFSWAAAVGSAEQQLCLRGIDAELPRGKLTAIVGPVGAGKSSLLAALLGELELVQVRSKTSQLHRRFSAAKGGLSDGAVEWRGLAPQRAVAYVAQTPFLLQATVRENILLQYAYVRDRYVAVVAACGMQRDIDGMAAGDSTEVSEGGASLSGGQQMRLSLARAVYAALTDAESGDQTPGLVLLDDPLSALDNHLGRHVFEQCICGLLRHHTVVMATHALHVLSSVDHVLLLDNGRLVGTYTSNPHHNVTTTDISERLCFLGAGTPGEVFDESPHPLAAAYRAAGAPEPEPEPEADVEDATADRTPHEDRQVAVKKSDGRGQLTAKEDRTSGAVVWETYASYVRAAGGGWSAAGVVALYVLGQCVFLGGDLWLAGWADRNALAWRSDASPSVCDLEACTCGPYDLSR